MILQKQAAVRTSFLHSKLTREIFLKTDKFYFEVFQLMAGVAWLPISVQPWVQTVPTKEWQW